jgi:FKBP-type peptidyl-prolyl cis-trans isomerase FklB
MKKTLRSLLTMGVGAGLLQAAAAADNNPATPPPPAAPRAPQATITHATNNLQMGRPQRPAPPAPKLPPGFKDQKEQMSYSIGMSIAKNIKQGQIDLDVDVLTGAMKEFLAGGTMRMTDEQMMQGIRAYQSASGAKREEERAKTAEKNHKAGDAFLAENKKKEGVKTLTVALPGGKTAEMQYKIITEGTGAIPKSNDVVQVKYRGTTLDGKQIDSSTNRGPNAVKMPVNSRGALKGWSEAWQNMKAGSKWELYIPSNLARGDRPTPDVEAGSTLIYEMELIGIEAPPAPRASAPGPAPLTSDIIKVPSAEQIKKGAKPEIIKAEDAEKEMQKEKKQ